MTSNPYNDPRWKRWEKSVRDDLVPKLANSAMTISMISDEEINIQFAVELGVSIMMDKPIIAVVLPGATPSAKLVAVCDEIVEGSPIAATTARRIQEAVKRVLAGLDES
jgi:hypothetical protein